MKHSGVIYYRNTLILVYVSISIDIGFLRDTSKTVIEILSTR